MVLCPTPRLVPTPRAAPRCARRVPGAGARCRPCWGRVDTVWGLGHRRRCDGGRVPGTWQVPDTGPPIAVLGHDADLALGHDLWLLKGLPLRKTACFLFLQRA